MYIGICSINIHQGRIEGKRRKENGERKKEKGKRRKEKGEPR
jgi:hypothetical protein